MILLHTNEFKSDFFATKGKYQRQAVQEPVRRLRQHYGNPIRDSIWNYIWGKGHQLQQISKLGDVIRIVYNEDVLCVQKLAVAISITNYTLQGDVIDLLYYTGPQG